MSDEEPTPSVVITPVITHVEINSGGHQVIIESAGSLRRVAKKALELWQATDDKAITKGYGTSVGFHTELCPTPIEKGDADQVGFRVVEVAGAMAVVQAVDPGGGGHCGHADQWPDVCAG